MPADESACTRIHTRERRPATGGTRMGRRLAHSGFVSVAARSRAPNRVPVV